MTATPPSCDAAASFAEIPPGVDASTADWLRAFDERPMAPSPLLKSTPRNNGTIDLSDWIFVGYDVHPDYVIESPTLNESIFRHSGWQERRRKVWAALNRVGSSGTTLQAFACCGSGCWVQHSQSTGRYRLSFNACKSRWCVPCGTARAARLRASVKDALADFSRVRFVTLTLRHNRTPLKDQIDRLYSCFKELRRRPFWKEAVTGSAAFCEVKVSEKDGLWHPHLHVLCVGSWMDGRELSRQWHAVTGDSTIVGVELARSTDEVAGYVTKYVTKPMDSSVLNDPNKLDEAIVAMRGRRLVNGAGLLKGICDRPAGDVVADWHTIARLDSLLDDAERGDAAALKILALLTSPVRSRDVERPPPS